MNSGRFHSNYFLPRVSFLFVGKRQNVTINIHDTLLRQFPRVVVCQMTSGLPGVTRQTGHSPNTRQSSVEVTQ